MSRVPDRIAGALFLALPTVSAVPLAQSGGSCPEDWIPTFGASPGTDDVVYSLHVFDDGTGPALFAGGSLFSASGAAGTSRVARWNGTTWSPTGGPSNTVYALTSVDTGAGPRLYALTALGQIYSYDGESWALLPPTGHYGTVLAGFDDGSGPALYVGFGQSGGVWRWDGSHWTSLATLGSGFDPVSVSAMTVYDDGSGPALYAAFSLLDNAFFGIARWNGSQWTSLGNFDGVVTALTVFDEGSGPALVAGGPFTTAGGVPVQNVARWSGSGWAPLGAPGLVRALAALDDGGGPALYASIGTGVQRWDGSAWNAAGGSFSGTNASLRVLAVYDEGSGPRLFAGGTFADAEGRRVNNIARWSGVSWDPVGAQGGLDAQVTAVLGDGAALYASGSFTRAGDVTNLSRIALWDGQAWSALGSGLSSSASALAVFDDGTGPDLFAGGTFGLREWDGSAWTIPGGGTSSSVSALTVFDDGTGAALYVGGSFTTAGGAPASRIARWNGVSWSPLGAGVGSVGVGALAVFDDGTGPALYAGGHFSTAGSVSASNIARWNGAVWTPLGSGTNQAVTSLCVHDDGGGPALYAGGDFTTAGGIPVANIARWDGSSWSAVGGGLDYEVRSLTALDDGNGPVLYGGGSFSTAGGAPASYIARWDGTSWSPLGPGTGFFVNALGAYDDGSGPRLAVGGSFFASAGSGDSYLALWGAHDTTAPTITCPESVRVLDPMNTAPGEVVTFSAHAVDACDAAPSVVCSPPSGSVFPPGRTWVTCTATDASGNKATCRFLVVVVRGIR